MGCNCGGVRNTMRGRPISGPRQRGVLTGATPMQLRALAVQNNSNNVSALSASGMNKKRRDIEKKRRAAVQKALGRP